MDTIAKRARTSPRQVRRILDKLNGIILPDGHRIVEIDENRGRKGGTTYNTNRYKLNLTSCPVSFGLIPVTGDLENLTSEPVNMTPENLNRTSEQGKPDTAMSDEPSGTVSKKQPSEKPTREFNSTESGFLLAAKLCLSGRDLKTLCVEAIETAVRELKISPEQAVIAICAKWEEYDSTGGQYKVGKIKYLKTSEFLNGRHGKAKTSLSGNPLERLRRELKD